MGIVQNLTPEFYCPLRLVVEIKPDTILTTDSLSFYTDIKILNINGKELGRDHPVPNINQTQLTAFLNWILTNLQSYETQVGLTRYTE